MQLDLTMLGGVKSVIQQLHAVRETPGVSAALVQALCSATGGEGWHCRIGEDAHGRELVTHAEIEGRGFRLEIELDAGVR